MGDTSQHSRAFHNLEAALAEEREHMVVGGDCRGIDHQRFCRIAEFGGDGRIGIVGEAYPCALGDEIGGEFGGSAVVTCHGIAFRHEIALKRRHADAAGSHEIYVCHVRHILFNKTRSFL